MIDPVVRLHYVEVEEPDLASPTSDLGRLREALEREWQLHRARLRRPRRCRGLQHDARGPAAGAVTVAVHDERAIVGVWPGLLERAYGIAVRHRLAPPSPATSATSRTGEVLALGRAR